MIDKVLPTQPISKFRQSGNEILDELVHGPVVLTQHGIGAGVLMSIDLYNKMVAYIRSFSDVELLRRRLLEMDSDDRSYITAEEFDAQLKQRGLLNG